MNCLFLPKVIFFLASAWPAFLILNSETSGLRLPLKKVDVCPFWQKDKVVYEFNHFCFSFYIFGSFYI